MEEVQRQLSDVRDQLGGALEFVMDDLRQKWRELSGGPSVSEGLKQFFHAVDWSERWIQGLMAFHLLLLILVLLYRRFPVVHAAIFLGTMPLIYFAERINGLAARHWRSFAKQNYFDSQGIFTSAMLSAPLLLIMFVILVNYLVSTSVLLVKMKRKELEVKARQQHRAAAAAGGGGSQTAGQGAKQAAAAGGATDAKKER
ncbi:hypothetical protein CHLNCDRAFT_133015 [Chlorella variabilis]|uniref:Uncharacterized protein n=1 Tax=Chlorella variabilis TaxID=554065 RepID=E1Z258_CHLVA|nr:hypothetical protein CHLNCDRAFT_133015 [Chlorella variabilis]EFN59942.1 hypothetical protein CHLNCDRAFT_133015 [Chlorella variabilis]|eukprot:XP_005852044.1 hypothetical protein CHLNCDRAFT_133015 [Chlorella variabilis]